MTNDPSTRPTSGVTGVSYSKNGKHAYCWLAEVTYRGERFRRRFPPTDAGKAAAIAAIAEMRALIKDTDEAASQGNTPSAVNTSSQEETMSTPTTGTHTSADGHAYDESDLPGISAEEYAASLKLSSNFKPHISIGLEEAMQRISFAWVDPKKVRFDAYARDVDRKRVEEMGSNLNMLLATACVLNRRANGSLYIIDGGHRVVTAIKNDVSKILALIIDGLTAREEAWLAAHYNRNRKQATQVDKFGMLLFSHDAYALDLLALVEETGFTIATKGEGGSGAYAIGAVETLRRINDNDEGVTLKRALDVLKRSWYGQKEATHRDLLTAVARIIAAWPDRPGLIGRLAQRMKAETYATLAGKARAESYSKINLTSGWIKALLWAYNSRLAAQNQLDPNLAINRRANDNSAADLALSDAEVAIPDDEVN